MYKKEKNFVISKEFHFMLPNQLILERLQKEQPFQVTFRHYLTCGYIANYCKLILDIRYIE